MTAIGDVATADGWFKDVFGDVLDVRPDGLRLLEKVPYDSDKKLGQQLSEVVWLTGEHGFSYSNSASGDFDLNEAVAAESDELTLSGAEIILQSKTRYKNFSTAVKGGKEAFGSYFRQKVKNMRKAHLKRLEITCMHGGNSLATIASSSGSGTTRTWTMTVATWAPLIWAGSRNCPVDVYNSTTLINTNADVIVTSIDWTKTAPKISVSGNATDLTNASVAGYELYFKGAYGNEATGMIDIVSNAGTLHGIDSTTYDLWAGNTITAGSAALTWSKIQDGIEEAAGRGLDGDLCLFVSFPTWSDLNSDLAALRKIDASYQTTKTQMGTKQIEYFSHNGMVEVVPSGFCKGGEAFAFPKGEAELIGSTTQTFQLPGLEGAARYFLDFVADKSAVVMQSYSDVAPKLDAPAKGFLINNIVNT